MGGWRPFATAAAPWLSPLPAAAILFAAGLLGRPATIVLAAASIACAAARIAVEQVRTDLARERADRWLITHAGQPPRDALIRARIAELLAPRRRRLLAASLRRVAADPPPGRGWALVGRRRRPELSPPALDELAGMLADLRTPVSPRGVALATQLLTDAGSPLVTAQPQRLAAALAQALAALPASR